MQTQELPLTGKKTYVGAFLVLADLLLNALGVDLPVLTELAYATLTVGLGHKVVRSLS